MSLTYAYGADSEKYAILVGVANYQNIRPLKYTINDVYSMKNLLTEQNFTTYTLIDSNATKENIKSTIYNVSSMVKENDTFIFISVDMGQMVQIFLTIYVHMMQKIF